MTKKKTHASPPKTQTPILNTSVDKGEVETRGKRIGLSIVLLSFFCGMTALSISLEMWREGLWWAPILGWGLSLAALAAGVVAFSAGKLKRRRWIGLRVAFSLAVGGGLGAYTALTLDGADGRWAMERDQASLNAKGSCDDANAGFDKWLNDLSSQTTPPHRLRVGGLISVGLSLETRGCRQDWIAIDKKLFDVNRADWKESGRWVWIPTVRASYWPNALDGCLIEAGRSGLAQDRARCVVSGRNANPWIPKTP